MTADAGLPPAAVLFTLRPLGILDQDFSYQVYASTRADEMKLVDWTEEQKEAFCRMQFNAQREHYLLYYPNAEYYMIMRGDLALGRLILDRSKSQILIMDVTLLPEYQRAGTGTVIIKDVLEEASQAGLPVVLRVEFFNPVIQLYTRLGFIKTREVNSVYHEMVWTPSREALPDGG